MKTICKDAQGTFTVETATQWPPSPTDLANMEPKLRNRVQAHLDNDPFAAACQFSDPKPTTAKRPTVATKPDRIVDAGTPKAHRKGFRFASYGSFRTLKKK